MLSAVRVVVLVVLCLAPVVALAQEAAGSVTRLKGTATAAISGVARTLGPGSPVFAGDRIRTGNDTRLELRMADQAVITLGDDTEFTVGEFEAGERGRVLGLVQGVFLAASGTLRDGRLSPATLYTPLAVIGVRGTTVWGVQSPEKLQVVLLDGRLVFVESQGRRIDLTEPLTLTVVVPGEAPTAPARVPPDALEAAKRTVAFD